MKKSGCIIMSRLSEHQKEMQNVLRQLSIAPRIIATYEAEIGLMEQRIERADKESREAHASYISELREDMKKYQGDIETARRMIDSVPDGIGKRILTMRYLHNMRMEDIADILHYDNTYLYRIYYDTLDKLCVINKENK